ncbi:LOW QUALITY PROTEIN: uncharacterized protein LOC119558329 [Drosophila subpulchrella]|uniref:LOW QUALITY PROTEIN: uncharacterized protein LOC119558329 n=1 Tax=Drosophila subpulchrella TaxID=1486046 RepID=UPI0018A14D31|nr:LOW QUALITY PROTEIN: uncharacterized protein LOC119558329 [Drosophila subpulchrella]
MGPSMEEDYRMQDATFCSCFHVFMAQIIAVIKNNKNKMAGQDQDDRIGSWFLRTIGMEVGMGMGMGMLMGEKESEDELRDVDADAISTEFCSINDKL